MRIAAQETQGGGTVRLFTDGAAPYVAAVLLFAGSFAWRGFWELLHTPEQYPGGLLNLYGAGGVAPTFLNLVIGKCAVFFLVWGVLVFFGRIGRSAGGLAAAVLLVSSSVVSGNSGSLAVYWLFLAAWWWTLAAAPARSPALRVLLPVAVALAGVFLLSPWALLLIAISTLAIEEDTYTRRWMARLGAVPVVLSAVFVPLIWLARGDLGAWLDRARILGLDLGGMFLPVFSILLGAVGVYAAAALPHTLVALAAALVTALACGGFDLAGWLFFWAASCALAGFAFDALWRTRLLQARVLARNGLAVAWVAALFALQRADIGERLLSARTANLRDFSSRCAARLDDGGWAVAEGAPCGDAEDAALAGAPLYAFPARYRATFRVRAAEPGSRVTVGVGKRKEWLGEAAIPAGREPCAISIEYDTEPTRFQGIVHRVFFSGRGDLQLDGIETEVLP